MAIIYIYIYDLETKEKKYIRREELSNIFDMDIFSLGNPQFIDANTIMYEASDLSDAHHYHFSRNINENRIKNFININYTQSVVVNDSLLLLCNQLGVIGYLNKNIVSVKDFSLSNDIFLIYNNNQLEYYSNESFTGESFIYDTTGKQVLNLGSQTFVIGRNTIQINQPLPIGVYLLTIKNDTNQFSYKFIVE